MRRKLVATVVAASAIGTGVGAFLLSAPSAGADPKQFSALVGVGSDTIQDVANALAGDSNNIAYTPIKSSAASGSVQIASWNAIGSTCITPKAPGATINRSNGSSQGRRALSRAIDGTSYGTTACGAAAKPVSGLIDFARSSAGPASGDTATDLTYIPIGRDGVSFAYYRSGGAAVTSLTRAQLISVFSSGPQTINGVRVVGCGIQTGSGTKGFWQTALGGISDTAEDTATTACNSATTTSLAGNRIEENQPDSLKAKGDSAAMTTGAECTTGGATGACQVIAGMSAASFIAQSNGVAPSHTATGVDLGAISDNGATPPANLGQPYSGTAPNLVASSTFYADSTFGRRVYFVVDTARAVGLGNNDLKTLMVGAGSAVCSTAAQATVNKFGFLTPTDCGATSITGGLIAGTL